MNSVAQLISSASLLASADDPQELSEVATDVLQSVVAADKCAIYIFDDPAAAPQHVASRGVSDYFLALYEDRGRGRDPVLKHVLEQRSAVDSDSLMSRLAWIAQPYYSEVLSIHRMDAALAAPILNGDRVTGTIDVAGEQRFSNEDREMVTALGRLVGVQLTEMTQRSSLMRERDQLHAALELSDQATVLTDLRNVTRRVNSAARLALETIVGADDPAYLEELLGSHRSAGGEIRRSRVQLKDGGEAELQVRSVATPDRTLLLTYLRVVTRGGLLLPHDIAHVLSPREREVATLALTGLRDAEIAERLYLSRYTVKEYLSNVYEKLSVKSRTQLVALIASRSGT
jgi:DNA-binding CsgD family transcriptional regulator/GAF domain-containing protein